MISRCVVSNYSAYRPTATWYEIPPPHEIRKPTISFNCNSDTKDIFAAVFHLSNRSCRYVETCEVLYILLPEGDMLCCLLEPARIFVFVGSGGTAVVASLLRPRGRYATDNKKQKQESNEPKPQTTKPGSPPTTNNAIRTTAVGKRDTKQ